MGIFILHPPEATAFANARQETSARIRFKEILKLTKTQKDISSIITENSSFISNGIDGKILLWKASYSNNSDKSLNKSNQSLNFDIISDFHIISDE